MRQRFTESMPMSKDTVFSGALFSIALILTAFTPFTYAQNADNVIRIGYQKYGTLVLLKARGSLEKRLAPLHVEVEWTEFPAQPGLTIPRRRAQTRSGHPQKTHKIK